MANSVLLVILMCCKVVMGIYTRAPVSMGTKVVPEPCFNLGKGSLATAAGLMATGNLGGGALMGALGGLFTVQAGRVRFEFDEDALELKIDSGGEVLASSGENKVVGGANRWAYDTFTDWFFIPSKDFPILMYFKETQTSPDGQVHFFPVVSNAAELHDAMMTKIGPR